MNHLHFLLIIVRSRHLLLAVVAVVLLMIAGRYGVVVAYGDKVHIELGPK